MARLKQRKELTQMRVGSVLPILRIDTRVNPLRRRTLVSFQKRRILRLENKHQPLLTRTAFALRVTASFSVSTLLIGLSLLGGMIGYHYTENMEWIDAFANAAMILSGMGPLASPQTWNGKLFAGLYALYSGLVLILATGILLAPVAHRLFHRFNLEPKSRT